MCTATPRIVAPRAGVSSIVEHRHPLKGGCLSVKVGRVKCRQIPNPFLSGRVFRHPLSDVIRPPRLGPPLTAGGLPKSPEGNGDLFHRPHLVVSGLFPPLRGGAVHIEHSPDFHIWRISRMFRFHPKHPLSKRGGCAWPPPERSPPHAGVVGYFFRNQRIAHVKKLLQSNSGIHPSDCSIAPLRDQYAL